MSDEEGLPGQCDLAAFKEAAKEYPDLYVILASQGCEPCASLAEQIKAAEIPHPLVEIPVDECPNLVDHFKPNMFPTVIHMQKGKEVQRFEGAQDDVIEKMKAGQ
jgi:thioredoxin-like negative regulator of GroEL